MVKVGFGLNGLQAWVIQRISAAILVLYLMLLSGIWCYLPSQTIGAWQHILGSIPMRYVTLLALLAMLLHCWLGLWIVITDYFKNPWLRLTAQIFVYLALFFYLVWGVQILWQ